MGWKRQRLSAFPLAGGKLSRNFATRNNIPRCNHLFSPRPLPTMRALWRAMCSKPCIGTCTTSRSMTEQRQAWDELTAVCRRDDVLYSYKHALLAKIGDEPVGLILPMTRQLSPPPHAHLRPSAGLCRNGRREHGDEAVAGDTTSTRSPSPPRSAAKALAQPSLPKPWRKPHNSDCAPPCWLIPTTPLRADSTRPAASARAEPSPLSGKPICACRPKCASLFKKIHAPSFRRRSEGAFA